MKLLEVAFAWVFAVQQLDVYGINCFLQQE
jgi:hypothetical protein